MVFGFWNFRLDYESTEIVRFTKAKGCKRALHNPPSTTSTSRPRRCIAGRSVAVIFTCGLFLPARIFGAHKELTAPDVPVAQLDRASDYGSEGHRFESCRACQKAGIAVRRLRHFAFWGGENAPKDSPQAIPESDFLKPQQKRRAVPFRACCTCARSSAG